VRKCTGNKPGVDIFNYIFLYSLQSKFAFVEQQLLRHRCVARSLSTRAKADVVSIATKPRVVGKVTSALILA
jgi:hypothetical protein